MKIVLLKEVQGLGRAGDIKDINNGYARNFLIPNGLADLVTKHSLLVLEAQKNKRERKRKQAKKNKKLLARKIDGRSFAINVKADEKGSLYAKLNAKAVAQKLSAQGFIARPDEVKLEAAIKKTGEHEVELRLGGEKAIIKLVVKSEKQEIKKL